MGFVPCQRWGPAWLCPGCPPRGELCATLGVEGQPRSQPCPSTPEPGRNHTSTGLLVIKSQCL